MTEVRRSTGKCGEIPGEDSCFPYDLDGGIRTLSELKVLLEPFPAPTSSLGPGCRGPLRRTSPPAPPLISLLKKELA